MPAIRNKEPRRSVRVFAIATLRRLCRDRRGVTAVVTGMSMAFLLGLAGLGTEVANWYVTKRSMQGAADAAAYSAAVAGGQGQSYTTEGNAIASSFGYTNGVHNVTVEVNNPPSSGAYSGLAAAYEVIISQPQPQLFSKLFLSSPNTITARAVASTTGGNNGCVMTLGTDPAAGITINGSDTVALNNCNVIDNATGSGSLTMNGGASSLSANSVSLGGTTKMSPSATLNTTTGLWTNQAAASDPYSSVDPGTPADCTKTGTGIYHNTIEVSKPSVTLNPGTYCGGITIQTSTVTLNPGIYYINDGSFTVGGNSTITGTNVTIVFTSDDGVYGTLSVTGNDTITLSAPTTGATAGFVFFETGKATARADSFGGGNDLNLTGIIYLPSQNLTYNGKNSSGCTQIVANSVTFNGDVSMGGACSGLPGLTNLGNQATKLVE